MYIPLPKTTIKFLSTRIFVFCLPSILKVITDSKKNLTIQQHYKRVFTFYDSCSELLVPDEKKVRLSVFESQCLKIEYFLEGSSALLLLW